MVAWWWLIVAFVGGMAVVGIPALLWLFGLARAWDRGFGFR